MVIKIKLTNQFPEWPLEQQTPSSNGVWGNYHFFINKDIDKCDYWVVYEGLLQKETTICDPKKIIFITGEPPNIKKYNEKFLKQFPTIVTCHRGINAENVIYNQQGLPWHIGRHVKNINISFSKNYDDLKNEKFYKKNKNISIIISKKEFSPGHKIRLKFLEKLQKNVAIDIDIFGRGIRDIEDKWDAIAPYKYHIVLENSSLPDYFTEKLSDAYLGGSYPLYYGCTNIDDYFPIGSLTPIDITNFDLTMNRIVEAIDKNYYEKFFNNIMYARNLVLDKYNLFPLIVDIIENKIERSQNDQQVIQIYPETSFNMFNRIFNRLKYKLD